MSITIAERLHPYSHTAGTFCMLPGTEIGLQIFPTLIHVFADSAQQPICSVRIDLEGPLRDFTVEVDLEKGRVRVYGFSVQGYFCYLLEHRADGIGLTFEKIAFKQVQCHLAQLYTLHPGETLLVPIAYALPQLPIPNERLSLGMHRAQDWDGLKRRFDFKEIFPLWMRLGCATPQKADKGALPLLQTCLELIDQGRKDEIFSAFKRLFLAGFRGLLHPRLFDDEYQGISGAQQPNDSLPDALSYLSQGALAIRSLFFQEREDAWIFLPCVPADFHCGRMVHISTQQGDLLDFEWSKKQLQQVHTKLAEQRPLRLRFPKEFKRVRLRHKFRERGQMCELVDGFLYMPAEHGCALLFDRFQK